MLNYFVCTYNETNFPRTSTFCLTCKVNLFTMSGIKIHVQEEGLNGNDVGNHTRQGKQRVCKHFKEYADGTSLHGIKYIGEDGRHAIERYRTKFSMKNHIYIDKINKKSQLAP